MKRPIGNNELLFIEWVTDDQSFAHISLYIFFSRFNTGPNEYFYRSNCHPSQDNTTTINQIENTPLVNTNQEYIGRTTTDDDNDIFDEMIQRSRHKHLK